MTETAADTYLNQAESLKDGQKNICPVQRRSTGVGCPFAGGEQEDARVDLNKASKEELMTLNGIGESRADAILGTARSRVDSVRQKN